MLTALLVNFLLCKCAKDHENWSTADKVIAIMNRVKFLDHSAQVQRLQQCD